LCFATHRKHDSHETTEVADNLKLEIDDDDEEQILSAISSFREQSEQTQQDTTEFRSKAEEREGLFST